MSQQKMIVILGINSVGKSALTRRYIQDEFHDHYDPAIIMNREYSVLFFLCCKFYS